MDAGRGNAGDPRGGACRRGQGGAALDKHTRVLNMLGTAAQLFESSMLHIPDPPDALVDAVAAGIQEKGTDYVTVIQGLKPAIATAGSNWLEGIQNAVINPLSVNA